MSQRSEYAEDVWKLWEQSGGSSFAPAHQVAQWAINNNHWTAKPASLVEQCVEELTAGWREVYIRDKHGRSVRGMHAVTVKTKGGVQETIWTHLDTITHDQMELLMNQHRKQVAGQVVASQLALDYYREKHPNRPPIQTAWDFQPDIDEQTQVPTPSAPLPVLSSSGR
jgi:hypothetical protein